MQRRSFLKFLLTMLGSATVASFVYPLLRFIAPLKGEAKTQVVVLAKSEIPPGGAKEIVFNNKPALVINHAERGLIAFTRVCTHLGCLIEYSKKEDRIICPCHAGTFDLDGNVLSGPPPKPLPKLLLRVEGENIVIG